MEDIILFDFPGSNIYSNKLESNVYNQIDRWEVFYKQIDL